ncbi:MAG: heavy metal-binding domain-containing protein [Saprospiraceae bacterium]
MRRFTSIAFYFGIYSLFLFPECLLAQCCAGGSGCTIAGGASQGVLQERQVELSTNFQFINTTKFYKRDNVAVNSDRTFDGFSSSYQYLKIGYGVTKNFTFSVETGYYFEKKETGLESNPVTTYKSKGIGDLILFPRYDILNRFNDKHHDEITLGLGYKIPLGSYKDSTGNIEPFSGQTFYVTNPTSVQLSSGAPDAIFYTFLSHGFTKQKFSIFANIFYVMKGFNPNGEKLGNYASVALFASKSLFNHLGMTLQARYEQVQPMKINESVFLFGQPTNYYPEATGYKKVFITPQISYTKGKFSVFISSDFPVYQYLNTSDYYTQAGSQFQTTLGLSYRFFAVKSLTRDENGTADYSCPMHPDVTSSQPGKCPKCGMDLEKNKDKL